MDEYKIQGRGGSGIKTAEVTAKTGEIIGAKVLTGDLKGEEIVVISKKGQVIRTKGRRDPVAFARDAGRAHHEAARGRLHRLDGRKADSWLRNRCIGELDDKQPASRAREYNSHPALRIFHSGIAQKYGRHYRQQHRIIYRWYSAERCKCMKKIVVTVPVADSDKIREAIGQAGGGNIGNYSFASFSARGVGRFKPEAGANPAIGEIGKLEEVEEERVEFSCADELVSGVVAAIKKAHPYEEPVIDIYSLE
jgi:hypothetical protein